MCVNKTINSLQLFYERYLESTNFDMQNTSVLTIQIKIHLTRKYKKLLITKIIYVSATQNIF